MGLHDLFPQPRQLTLADESINLAGRTIVLSAPPNLPILGQRAVELVQATLSAQKTASSSPYVITVQFKPDELIGPTETPAEEAYRLTLNVDAGQLVAASAAGLFA